MEPISDKDKRREADMAGWRLYDAEKVITERLLSENARLREELDRAKQMPMKYRRMEFNAQLQKESDELRKQLAAAPKAQAEKQEPVKITDGMAFAFAHAISDASLSQDDVEEIKTGLRAAFADISEPEPVKDEPVAWHFCQIGYWHFTDEKRDWYDAVGVEEVIPLYPRPQPDLTAEVERLREDSELLGNLLAVMHRDGGHHAFAVGNDQAMQDAMQVYYQHVQRIAELEEAAQQARDALQYHTSQTRPILNTTKAIAKLDAVLGNVEISPPRDAG